MKHETMVFKKDRLKLIDQRKLPGEVQYFQADDYNEVKFAISDMVVRGAPAIGAAAAYGVYLAALEYSALEKEEFLQEITRASKELKGARPTAVNLNWAIRRMNEITDQNRGKPVEKIVQILREGAVKIAKEDVKINKKMAGYGNKLIPEKARILTHCNTGALATVGYGTALGVIREAHRSGRNIQVYADETRPRLQGARLTTFELVEEGIPVTLIVDSAAATLIRDGKIDLILVGADRVAANGDTANKIGTYNLSALADRHGVPFYVVAPTSTIDFEVENGDKIEIEERTEEEVKQIQGVQIAPEAVNAYNPAFDVSPAENITGIVTEKGIARPPLEESLRELGD